MGLMKLINTENDKNYINLKQAIELLAKVSNSNIWEVATYLLNKDMHIRLYSFSRSIDHKIVQNSFLGYEGGQDTWIGDNDAFGWLQYIAENEPQSYAPRAISNFSKYYNGCIETFWDREAFLNDEYIKEALNLSDPFFKSISLEVEQASYEEYVSNSWISSEEPNYDFWNVIEQYLNDEDKKNYIPQRSVEYGLDKNYQKLCDQLKEENEKLKDELRAIKEEKLNPNNTNNDNLSFGMATICHASHEHYQKHRDELLVKVDELESEISQLKGKIADLEMEKMKYDQEINEINESEIKLINSDLLLVSVLLKMLQNEIKLKGNKSQAKILQRIEDENKIIKGLSKSRTEKIMANANSAFKSMKNNKMK